MSASEETPNGQEDALRLRIPHDFAMPGGPGEEISNGFVRLAEDEKGERCTERSIALGCLLATLVGALTLPGMT